MIVREPSHATASAPFAVAVEGPLQGVVVVDLGHVYAAPYATLLMALAGATVIKVEPPSGEHLRVRAEVLPGPRRAFAIMNSNKLSVTLDLKSAGGKEILWQLLEKADVLVENFRPKVLDSLGLEPESVLSRNPRLVYASASGFGRSGPHRDHPAMDLPMQAFTGVLGITGEPDGGPVKAGPALGDFLTGIHLYGAVTSALVQRARTDRGAVVEVAMTEAILPSMMSNIGALLAGAPDGRRTGNRHGGMTIVPCNVFAARDGYVTVMCETDRHWSSLVTAMGRDDLISDERFAETSARVSNMEAAERVVAEWTASRTAVEVTEALVAKGVPSAPVRSLGQVMRDPEMARRGMLHDVDHPDVGPTVLMQSPILFEEHSRQAPEPSRALGADNELVLGKWLGLSPQLLRELRADGVL